MRRARELIAARQYVLDSDWGEVQPNAEVQNSYFERHSWDEYALWHLGLTKGATEGTKARHAFVFGDFRRVHRSGLIACVYRVSQWRHKAVELARTTCCSISTAPPALGSGPQDVRRHSEPNTATCGRDARS